MTSTSPSKERQSTGPPLAHSDATPGPSNSVLGSAAGVWRIGTSGRSLVPWSELALGLSCLVLWFVVFTCGTIISSAPLRAKLATASTLIEGAAILPGVLLSWTVTNVGVLALCASLLGRFFSRAMHVGAAQREQITNASEGSSSVAWTGDPVLAYSSALLQGYMVYALVLAGLLALTTKSLLSPEPDEYVRLASLLSVVCFYVGFDSSAFLQLIRRVGSVLGGAREPGSENAEAGIGQPAATRPRPK